MPGTTIVGILGVIFGAYGIYLGYDYFGAGTGTVILISSVAVSLVALVVAFKGKSWERLSLKETNTGKFNENYLEGLQIGDRGKTISALKPIGKALFRDHEKEYEVRSNGGYINESIEVEISRIESNKIFVQPIKN